MSQRTGSEARQTVGAGMSAIRVMGRGTQADRSSGPAGRSFPHRQAGDMTAPVMFAKPQENPLTRGAVQTWPAGSRPSARDAAHGPNRATALTGERSEIYPLKERRSLLVPASGAGGVETSSVIGASSPSACRVLRRRSRAGPPAWRESSGCLAIALADGPRSG